ncbi:hypothetical protein [Haloferax sp. KTX1]|uniref:hypothetical protein n=1 Tax=Haloferax sp. KTX1 TaxID=2600597 RepID=UPI0011DDA1FF|nr:hypothetical protein [Haloferax sp. KTX1]
MNAKGIAAVLIAATIAATLFMPISNVVTGNTGTQSVVNETATADVGTAVDLDGYEVVADSETVYYDNGSGWTTATAGTDYSFDDNSASVTALSGGSIDDGAALRVSYDYQATSGSTTTITGLIPLFVALLILGVLAAKAMDGL